MTLIRTAPPLDKRVERAQELLRKTEVSCVDIAMRCGFADQAYFGKIFKQQTGQTPAAWRKGQRACASQSIS